MSDWITDRLPTDDDADCEGKVWITRDSAVERTDFLNVMPRRAWMPIDEPPPYQPKAPEPDTNLEANNERES